MSIYAGYKLSQLYSLCNLKYLIFTVFSVFYRVNFDITNFNHNDDVHVFV